MAGIPTWEEIRSYVRGEVQGLREEMYHAFCRMPTPPLPTERSSRRGRRRARTSPSTPSTSTATATVPHELSTEVSSWYNIFFFCGTACLIYLVVDLSEMSEQFNPQAKA